MRRTREGDYDDIINRIKKVKARALALIDSVTPQDELGALSLNRLFKASGEEIYGRISEVVAETARAVDKTLEDIQKEQSLPKADPLCGFMHEIKAIFSSHGVRFTCPKAKDDNYQNPKLSQAQALIRLALSCLPKESQPSNLGKWF